MRALPRVLTFIFALMFALAAMLAGPSARADESSPVGLWKNIDDVSGKPKALIRISDNKGELEGRIEKLFRPADQDQNPKCNLCEGANKDQPVIGMLFMSGLKKSGDEYTGGQILDPDNGKVYKSKLTLVEGGKKVNVRGYIGVPMLGRSQVWVRQE
ncbi:MAG: hypothetical protein JWR40_4569 [Massilia sp.]|jgi:uncharacterized protein (DUF2147 family)|nr:hypothetical protein [Massilia sp.]MDB5952974.1 hypothetical protein [Massilia sp.]